MHKNICRIHTDYFSQKLLKENNEQINAISQIVIDAVKQYNKILPVSVNFKGKTADERLIKEAEEESAKKFLDEVLNIMQTENIESNFFKR